MQDPAQSAKPPLTLLLKVMDRFELAVVLALIAFMTLLVGLSTWELGLDIASSIAAAPLFRPGLERLLDLFGYFLMILLGLEILDTLKAYLQDNVVHVEVVFVVAMIAIARKVIILDLKSTPGLVLVGLSALLAALAGSYIYIRRSTGARTHAS